MPSVIVRHPWGAQINSKHPAEQVSKSRTVALELSKCMVDTSSKMYTYNVENTRWSQGRTSVKTVDRAVERLAPDSMYGRQR